MLFELFYGIESQNLVTKEIITSKTSDIYFAKDIVSEVEINTSREDSNFFLSKIILFINKGVCELGKRYLKTFDWHVMELPDFSPCDVVLTMDCSPSAKFYVKVRSNKDTKKRVSKCLWSERREN